METKLVYVIAAGIGYDQEVEVLGVFSTMEAALAYKEQVNATSTSWSLRLQDASQIAYDRLREWESKVPHHWKERSLLEDAIKLREILASKLFRPYSLHDVMRLKSKKLDFINTLNNYIEKLSLPPLPDLPDAVEWDQPYRFLYNYNMDITSHELK